MEALASTKVRSIVAAVEEQSDAQLTQGMH